MPQRDGTGHDGMDICTSPRQPLPEDDAETAARRRCKSWICGLNLRPKRSASGAVDRALAQHEQVILFLNRRGTATYVFCRDCGWVAECPRCDTPLTYHEGAGQLICHRCGRQKQMPRQCPECRSTRVRAFGLGTEGLEAHVRERWPDARLARWDQDVARSHAAHTRSWTLVRGETDPDGTQIGSAWGFPGQPWFDISADTALNLRISAASGRSIATRWPKFPGAWCPDFHPTHYATAPQFAIIEACAARAGLPESGLIPPAIRLARLVYAHANRDKAASRKLLGECCAAPRCGLPDVDLIGPAPAFFARVRGRYR